jgi:hypothetical protein
MILKTIEKPKGGWAFVSIFDYDQVRAGFSWRQHALNSMVFPADAD